jgi:SAM-dependent methyltransferase
LSGAGLETGFDYAGKYEKGGRVGGWLVDRFFGAVESLCAGQRSARVLEVGCGEGYSTERLLRFLGPDVELRALDTEQRLVDAAARRNPRVSVRLGSIYALEEPDASVDLVLALEVLEHLEEPRRALAELRRVARGAVITSVPREPLWRFLNLCRFRYLGALGNTPGLVQHWSSGAFLRLVEDYGEVTAVRTPIPWTIVRWSPRPQRT